MFIPCENIKNQDRVQCIRDIKFCYGTFTAGHYFTVTGKCDRGYDLIDDDGNEACEVPGNALRLVS